MLNQKIKFFLLKNASIERRAEQTDASHGGSKTRLNACIFGLNFLSDSAKGTRGTEALLATKQWYSYDESMMCYNFCASLLFFSGSESPSFGHDVL